METVERDVTIIFEGRSYEITVYPGNSILDTALEAGIDLPYSCQYGSCGTCITKLVSGKVVMQDQTALSDEEIADGFCLTCVGYPASDHVILNYDDPSL
ncbi:MAG: 2Fe-2S iron-sulfur cluster binding domain-containing protein [Ignavibacteriales bacterium]|nr:2Fe-2S iron-sulfur cluster binding domain-containing protein [Ignavibacteriales bacterium]